MALNFPNTPADSEYWTDPSNGVQYIYSSAVSTWTGTIVDVPPIPTEVIVDGGDFRTGTSDATSFVNLDGGHFTNNTTDATSDTIIDGGDF